MAATLTSTGITFSDGTSLSTAFPAANAVGAYRNGWYTPTLSAPSGSDVANFSNWTAGTTISGGSLISDIYFNQTSPNGNAGYATQGFVARGAVNRVSLSMWGSGSSMGTANLAGPWQSAYVNYGDVRIGTSSITSGTGTYSTYSGSWRSMEAFSARMIYNSYYGWSIAAWTSSLWQRYA